MVAITYVQRDGSEQLVTATEGGSIMQAALDAGIRGIHADCGGSLACATCHVYVEGAAARALPAFDMIEDELLDGVASPRLANSRLSCQIVVDRSLDGLIVRVPERQM